MAHALDRRAQLAQAAYDQIAERGLAGLSLRTVARSVGATTGLVSHHFADRQDLVHAALDHATAVASSRVAAAGADPHPVEIVARVLPVDDESIRVWRFTFSVRAAALFEPQLADFDRRFRDEWARHLPARLEPYVAGDPAAAARHLVVLIDGLALAAVTSPVEWPAEVQIAHVWLAFHALETTDLPVPADAPTSP